MTKGNQNISCSKLWREVQWVNDADRSGADAIRAGCAFLFLHFFFLSSFQNPLIFIVPELLCSNEVKEKNDNLKSSGKTCFLSKWNSLKIPEWWDDPFRWHSTTCSATQVQRSWRNISSTGSPKYQHLQKEFLLAKFPAKSVWNGANEGVGKWGGREGNIA